MKFSLLFVTCAALGLADAKVADNSSTNSPILYLSPDENFNFDILTGLAQARNDGADIGPVLGAAKDIVPGDFESYSETWFKLANQTKAQVLDPEIAYDLVNVRATWFSVANYFRRADVYNRADWDDPRINNYWDEQRAAFDKAIFALPIPAERIELPADTFNISGIWYPQTHTGNTTKRFPTLILTQGFDAAQEDLYSIIVAPAIARGYNVFSFEGPGQPTPRREQGLGFITDWERTVTPVVDYLLTEKAAYVDSKKLILYGHSFGGYLAARAAAFEPRLSALMLNGGVLDAYDAYSNFLPPSAVEILESGEQQTFDRTMDHLLTDPDTSTDLKWGILQAKWCFKTKSIYEFFQMTKQYTLKGGLLDRIQMPVWIADGEYENLMEGQSRRVKAGLGDRAELHVFNGTAGFHCQTGASQELNRVMFAWLDKVLGV